MNFVSWGDAARFCNWLSNGQKNGVEDALTTETGAYTLNGANTNALLMQVTRDSNARYVIPTLDETYKAAFYDPDKNNLGSPGYWLYPTKHNAPPTNILDPTGTNNANFYDDVAHRLTIGAPYYRTEVGAFAASPGPWGTFDQGADVGVWNETAIGGAWRSTYGTDFSGPRLSMSKGIWIGTYPTSESSAKGFRIADLSVPEPNTILMMLIAGLCGGPIWRRILRR